MFYEFNQNNSGGRFVVDEKLCHRLLIEAENIGEAVLIASELGCYWDGVSLGMDCSCCGDRWHIPYSPVDDFPREIVAEDYISLHNWNKKYKGYKIIEQPQPKKSFCSTYYTGKIELQNIEEYAQYLADNYGATTPDARIYNLAGKTPNL